MSAIPLLSVCIPTFNRQAFLQENLEALLPQAEALGVEVCVSDNASTDGTSRYLSSFGERFSLLRVVKQPRNIGLDRNMLAAIRMARGLYVYPLGDDDLIPRECLAKILQTLVVRPDVVVLNGWHTDPRLAPQRLHLNPGQAGTTYGTAEDAFANLWDKMPFGSFLASRRCFRDDTADRYLDTSHAYTGIVWEGLARLQASRGRVCVDCTNDPLVMIRGAQKTWSANADLILLQEIPAWFSAVGSSPTYAELTPPTRQQYLARQTSLVALLRLRAAGLLRAANLDRIVSECSAPQRFRIRAVACLPIPLLKYCAALAKPLLNLRRKRAGAV